MNCKGIIGNGGAFILLAATTPLAASEWSYYAELYALGADVDISTASGFDATAEFDDILDSLEFAMFGSFAAKREKLALIANVLYVDVEDSETNTDGSGTTRVEAELETMVTTLAVGWELHESDTSLLHGVVGARWLALDSDFTLEIESLDEAHNSESTDIWDAVIGVQGRADFSDKWYLSYYADVGAGDSDLTWQATTALGYRFNHFDLALGYQYIEWEFDDLLLDDLQISGPALGLRFHW